MNHKTIITIIIPVLLLASISFLKVNTISRTANVHPVFSYDKELFYKGITQASKQSISGSGNIVGGVVPHHLLASFIIADFFQRLEGQKPETIILIGPNHFERGDFNVLSSLYEWLTPFGRVEPNTEIIEDLVKSNLVKIDEDALSKEHAIGAEVAFIKFYLPDVKIVPIIFSAKMNEVQAEIIAKKLSTYISKETVLVASLDFSHYLRSEEARKKDEITLQAMRDFNYPKIFTLNNDYLDSRSTLSVLL